MMILVLLYIIVFYFLLGGISIAIINKKNKSSQPKDRWTKYFFYLLVVCGTVACIQFEYLSYLAIIILIIGFKEIITAWMQSTQKRISLLLKALIIYIPIAILFYLFTEEELIEFHLFVYTIIFVFDGFAQITGQLFGKHKIFPKISPDKTAAGIIGGYISALTTAYFLSVILSMEKNTAIFNAFIIATAGMLGDLLASLFKRKCNIKDYSNWIPGHGGILDRFDSFILAGAVAIVLI